MATRSGAQAAHPQQFSIHEQDEDGVQSLAPLNTFSLDWASVGAPRGARDQPPAPAADGPGQGQEPAVSSPSRGRPATGAPAPAAPQQPQGAQALALRVRVASASELQRPSYKLGDFTSGLLAGEGSLLRSVYAVLQLGDCTLETRPAGNEDGRDTVSFEGRGDSLLFRYAGEAELRVELRNRRSVTSMFGGDPRIGEAVLSLDGGIRDGRPQERTLPVERKGTARGNVTLHYQLLAVQELSAAAPGAAAEPA